MHCTGSYIEEDKCHIEDVTMELIVFGTEGELRKALADLNQNMIQKTLAHKGIKWSFNPPAVSRDGGTWERIIRMIRKVLSSVLCQ